MRKKRYCPDCRAEMRFQKTEQEFEKEGTRVVVSGIPGWHCPNCHGTVYEPGIMDHVVKSARELLEAACMTHTGFATSRTIRT